MEVQMESLKMIVDELRAYTELLEVHIREINKDLLEKQFSIMLSKARDKKVDKERARQYSEALNAGEMA